MRLTVLTALHESAHWCSGNKANSEAEKGAEDGCFPDYGGVLWGSSAVQLEYEESACTAFRIQRGAALSLTLSTI